MLFASIRIQKYSFRKLRCKITAFSPNNQIFLVLLHKISVLFLFLCEIYEPEVRSTSNKYTIMRNQDSKEFGKKMRGRPCSSVKALSSFGITFIVLGVLLFAVSFTFNMKTNLLLFTGLFLILGGGIGYLHTLKKPSERK